MSRITIDVIDKIVLARDYNVSQWLLPSLSEYMQLGQPITFKDGNRLGLDYLVKIIQVRDTLLGDSTNYRRNYDFRATVKVFFEDEIGRSRQTWRLSRSSEYSFILKFVPTPQKRTIPSKSTIDPTTPLISTPSETTAELKSKSMKSFIRRIFKK